MDRVQYLENYIAKIRAKYPFLQFDDFYQETDQKTKDKDKCFACGQWTPEKVESMKQTHNHFVCPTIQKHAHDCPKCSLLFTEVVKLEAKRPIAELKIPELELCRHSRPARLDLVALTQIISQDSTFVSFLTILHFLRTGLQQVCDIFTHPPKFLRDVFQEGKGEMSGKDTKWTIFLHCDEIDEKINDFPSALSDQSYFFIEALTEMLGNLKAQETTCKKCQVLTHIRCIHRYRYLIQVTSQVIVISMKIFHKTEFEKSGTSKFWLHLFSVWGNLEYRAHVSLTTMLQNIYNSPSLPVQLTTCKAKWLTCITASDFKIARRELVSLIPS